MWNNQTFQLAITNQWFDWIVIYLESLYILINKRSQNKIKSNRYRQISYFKEQKTSFTMIKNENINWNA